MNLIEVINNDLKIAMKEGDKERLQTIRSIRALILEFQKSGSGKEFTEDEGINLLTSAVKKRKDSIEQYRNAGREDLALKEEKEVVIIQSYLPKQLSIEELTEELKLLIAETDSKDKKDFPKVMPIAVKKFKGVADGKIIKELLEQLLG